MLTLEAALQKLQNLPPEKQFQVIEFIEFLEFKVNQTKSPQISPEKRSFAEAAQDFIGCLDSDIEDLSYNPQYLEGFGK